MAKTTIKSAATIQALQHYLTRRLRRPKQTYSLATLEWTKVYEGVDVGIAGPLVSAYSTATKVAFRSS